MKCPYCRTENAEQETRCSRCGSSLEPIPASAPIPRQPLTQANVLDMVDTTVRTIDVPSYLLQSILVTIFCCMPLGIVAIVFAAQVGGHLSNRNYTAAAIASQKARTWCWVSFCVGIIPVGLSLLFGLLGTLIRSGHR